MKGKQKVLVTGANGFIGSHLVDALLKKGCYNVVCLLLPNEVPFWIKDQDVTIIYGDITNKESIQKVVSDTDFIYHLAALLRSFEADAFYRVNYEGTKNLVELCLASKSLPKRFLYVSSFAAVGPTGKGKIFDEEASCHPVSEYGKSKLKAEQYLKSLNGKLPYTTVRLPVVYGPGSFGGLYPFFKFTNKRIQFSFGKGETCVGFVTDIVEGMIQASESSNTVGKTYFLGENRIYTSQEIYNIVAKGVGKKVIKIRIPYWFLYIISFIFELYGRITQTKPVLKRDDLSSYLKYRYWRFDISQAEKEFGYRTKFPFEKGAKITADWYKMNRAAKLQVPGSKWPNSR